MILAHIHGEPIGPFNTRENFDASKNQVFETEAGFLQDVEAFIQ